MYWPPPGLVTGGWPAVIGGSAATTTWNNLDRDANITLTGGNLTFTDGATAYSHVRSIASHSSGKFYWEILCVFSGGTNNQTMGICNSTAPLNNYLGSDTNSMGWIGDGRVLVNNVVITNIQVWLVGDVLCFAHDLGNNHIWFRTNGGNWNNDVIGNQNPATNTGGITTTGMAAGPYFAIGGGLNIGDSATADFGATTYANTPPSGFGNL